MSQAPMPVTDSVNGGSVLDHQHSGQVVVTSATQLANQCVTALMASGTGSPVQAVARPQISGSIDPDVHAVLVYLVDRLVAAGVFKP